MSIMVGGAAGGTAIGMAPAARWIAAKLYNDAGVASYSDIHLAFQWLLDPDGDLGTVDAPDVVNASWGLAGTAGQCITEFSADIDALKTAGIAVAFAAGNDGPSPLTSLSPANNVQGLPQGQSTTCRPLPVSAAAASLPVTVRFTKLVAPGVNINTADLSFGGCRYAVVSVHHSPLRILRARWRCWRAPFPVRLSPNLKRH
jgi:bacillopeptidase F